MKGTAFFEDVQLSFFAVLVHFRDFWLLLFWLIFLDGGDEDFRENKDEMLNLSCLSSIVDFLEEAENIRLGDQLDFFFNVVVVIAGEGETEETEEEEEGGAQDKDKEETRDRSITFVHESSSAISTWACSLSLVSCSNAVARKSIAESFGLTTFAPSVCCCCSCCCNFTCLEGMIICSSCSSPMLPLFAS